MILKDYTRPDIRAKGIDTVTYVERVLNGDWSQDLSAYVQQRWGGLWDDDLCWCRSTLSYVIEPQLNFLLRTGQISPEGVAFFTANGYIVNGKFAPLSDRLYGILSKIGDNGGDPWWMAQYIQEWGFLPMSMLGYTNEQAQQWSTQEQFDADYFDPNAITPAMEALAKQAASYIQVNPYRVGEVGTSPDLQLVWAALRQCPLCIAIPIPSPTSLWNQTIVPYQGGTDGVHCVGIYETSPQYSPQAPSASVPIIIGDNYLPTPKTLQAGYFLCEVVAIVITGTVIVPHAVPQNALNNFVWSGLFSWLTQFWGSITGKVALVPS